MDQLVNDYKEKKSADKYEHQRSQMPIIISKESQDQINEYEEEKENKEALAKFFETEKYRVDVDEAK